MRMKRSSTLSCSGHQHPRLRTRSPVSLRAILSTVLVLLGLVWFLLSAVFHVSYVPRTVERSTSSRRTSLSTELFKQYLKVVAGEERNQPSPSTWDNLDLNYVSKRRVPSGPDPIHNRRAVKYRQPPGA
ncbi:uncharacterized protein LOC116213252 [Punica granatum]|uniref:Uncharacterized protein LOC116213252 n=2 Tax=Punica granatum TaxID=22663 RepID=A0A6P8EBT1_PUNGR|nr:uncharacterized protein LOC116213252 [Punica granatum]